MDTTDWLSNLSSHPAAHSLLTSLSATSATAPGFTSLDWLKLLGALVALILCATASAAETALTSVNRIKIKNLVETGDKKAALIEQLLAEPNKFLSTILVVNSVALIVASALATGLALEFSEDWGELIATILLSLVVLIFCEITPKTAAVQNPERWARALVSLVRGAAWLLTPLIKLLGWITSFLGRISGGHLPRRSPFITEAELRMMVNVSEEEGVLEEEEREMIHSIFELGDRPVREIMVPRVDMITLEGENTLDDAVTLIMQGGQSRIPVYEETIDNIIGVLYAKDLLRHLRQGNLQGKVRDFVRPAYFIPESKKLDDLLHELQQQRIHIAIVVDEYGAVAGLVTIEDLVEQIIGDIQDEYDKEEVLYEKVSDHEYIIDAKIGIDELNELLNTHLTDEDYDTLGGFVYTQLDKVPSVGDEVRYHDLTLTVLSTRGRRITKVKVVRQPPPPPLEEHQERNGGKNHTRHSGDLAAQREQHERASTGHHRSL